MFLDKINCTVTVTLGQYVNERKFCLQIQQTRYNVLEQSASW